MVIQENNLEVSRGKHGDPGTAEGSEGPISPLAGILGGRVPLRTFLAFRGLWICLISIQIWWVFYSRKTCKKNMCFLYIIDFFFFPYQGYVYPPLFYFLITQWNTENVANLLV